MPEFEYTARTLEGDLRHGFEVAQDERDLEKKITERNLVMVRASVGKSTAKLPFLDRFQSVPIVQKMFFTQYLEVMIRAGFSISRALQTLADQTSSRYFRRVILEIRGDVESGMSLSKSLAKHPRVFNEMYVNMISAGETSGKLDEVLNRLSIKMKKDHSLVGKIKGALTYPIIIVTVMLAIAILMTVVVIPKLTEVFKEANATLPFATKVLIAVSNFLIHNGLLVTVVAIAFISIWLRIIRSRKGKRMFDAAVLRIPILGPIVKKISLARFSRSLSSLLETNIPIIEAFAIIGRTMGNTFYREALHNAGINLKTGSTIAKSLRQYPRLFPPLVTQMIAVGEESGSLDSISGDLAGFYEDEVDQTMSNLSTIIEPVLMLLLGVGVAGIAVAVILPIYSLSQQIG
ncbi:MAG: type II secretion system F family protein [Candidatus Kerfeldbacteria bacterium]|nr:type II secretion system F family protein [Candidatus Kerfeldbacteria bacterium]